jgi:hypothetical protein
MFLSYVDTSAITNPILGKSSQTYTTFIEQQGTNYFLQNELERTLDE